jgi:O-antigen ligase
MFLILASRPLSLWFSGGTAITSTHNDVEGSLIDQAFYLSLTVGAWIVASRRGVKWRNLFIANIALTIFLLYFAVSVFWSNNPEGSFKRWFKLFSLVFVVSVILSEKDPMEAIRAVYVRCAYVLIPLSLVFIRYYPSWGRIYHSAGDMEVTGITTQKNSLGELVMICGFFLVWDYLEQRPAGAKRQWSPLLWERLILLLMIVWVLYLSQSKSALVCLLIGLALLMRSEWLSSVTINRMVLIGAMSSPFVVLGFAEFSSILDPLVESLGRDATLTGRTDIWRNVLAGTWVNPLIGTGFFSFWGGEGGEAIRNLMGAPGVHSAHNGYLDIYLDGGLIGLLLLFCLLLACGTRLSRSLNVSPHQRLKFAVLIVAILYNLSESTFARLTPLWFTTLLALIEFRSMQSSIAKTQ